MAASKGCSSRALRAARPSSQMVTSCPRRGSSFFMTSRIGASSSTKRIRNRCAATPGTPSLLDDSSTSCHAPEGQKASQPFNPGTNNRVRPGDNTTLRGRQRESLAENTIRQASSGVSAHPGPTWFGSFGPDQEVPRKSGLPAPAGCRTAPCSSQSNGKALVRRLSEIRQRILFRSKLLCGM